MNTKKNGWSSYFIACDFCTMKHFSRESLVKHIQYRHTACYGQYDDPLLCEACHKRLAMRTTLATHLKNCMRTQNPYGVKNRTTSTCDLCSAEIGELEMRTHLKYCHPSTLGMGKNSLLSQCEGCFRKFRHKVSLRRNLKSCSLNPNPFMKETENYHDKIQCELCNAKFPKPQTSNHIRRKHPELIGASETEKFYHCNYCSARCQSLVLLTAHFKVCEIIPIKNYSSAPRQFTCKKCGSSYITKDGLYQHRTTGKCSELPPLLCDRCGYANKCRGNFSVHIKRCKPFEARIKERVVCDRCTKTFAKKNTLVEHRRQCLMNGGENKILQFECDNCSYKTVYRDMLMLHMKTKRFDLGQDVICAECLSSRKEDLAGRPKLSPNPKWPRTKLCRVCGVRMPKFRKPRVYQTVRKCDYCKFSTKIRREMLRHKQNQHRQQIFACERCGSKLYDRANLINHILKQSCKDRSIITKTVTCDDCGISCSRRDLYIHMTRLHIHVERTKYACEECNQIWLMRNHFLYHKRKYAGKESCVKTPVQKIPYRCDDCGKEYAKRESIFSHISGKKCKPTTA